MIRCILFDIDDTLFPTSEFAMLARNNALRAMIELGINAEFADLNNALASVINKKGSNYPRIFDEVCRICEIKRPERYIAAAVAAYHNTKTGILPYPDVPRILLKLREHGYKLYIATNGNTIKQWDKLIRLGIALYFEDVFVSEEIGEEKSPSFFKKVLKVIKAKPNDAIMIGDREDVDVIPAKKAGMYSVRIRRGKYAKGKTCADAEVKDLSNILQIIKRLDKE